MASAQATAERHAASQHSINAAMGALSAKHGIPIPPPAPKSESPDAKTAGELDRVAQFMTALAGMADPGGYQPGVPVPGSIGDGYVDLRDNPEHRKGGGAGKSATGGTAGASDADESPVSDTNADEAIESIGRMRSKDRLQHVIDNDKRSTVKEAAQKRLEALNQ